MSFYTFKHLDIQTTKSSLQKLLIEIHYKEQKAMFLVLSRSDVPFGFTRPFFHLRARKIGRVEKCCPALIDQFYIPKINTVKYGTKSLRYNTPLI